MKFKRPTFFKVPLTLNEMSDLDEALKDIILYLEKANKRDEYHQSDNYQLAIAGRNRKIEKYHALIGRIRAIYALGIAIDVEE